MKKYQAIAFLAMIPNLIFPQAIQAAEKLYLIYGPLKFTLSVESLAIYAEQGTITPELAFYAQKLDPATLAKLQQALQKRHTIDEVRLTRLLKTPLMADLLKSLGNIFSTHPNYNGFYALRGALITAALAQKPEGWTVIDVMHHFPTEYIWIDIQKATKLMSNN